MKQLSIGLVLVVVVLALLALGGTFYVVPETHQVVITMFGKPIGQPVTTPGLKVKLPFFQTANYFDKRFLEWDGDPNQIPTEDKRFIWVDSYARWRITDPLLFAMSAAPSRASTTSSTVRPETRSRSTS
jgi:membrane protease subunit HflC